MKSFASILAFASLGTATAAFTGASVIVLSKDVGESPDGIVAGAAVGTALVAGEKVVITYVLRHGEQGVPVQYWNSPEHLFQYCSGRFCWNRCCRYCSTGICFVPQQSILIELTYSVILPLFNSS